MGNYTYVTDDCFIQVDEQYGSVEVGDDRHMNGLDSPARLRNVEDAMKLIEALNDLIKRGWPKRKAS